MVFKKILGNKLTKGLAALAIASGIFLSPKRVNTYAPGTMENPSIHPKLVEALYDFYRPSGIDFDKEAVKRGSINEDSPEYSYIRAFNHFQHGRTGEGLSCSSVPLIETYCSIRRLQLGVEKFLSAKEWITSPTIQAKYPHGDHTWDRVKEDFFSGKLGEHFGFVYHVLCDLDVSSHTRNDVHPVYDSYEHWTDKHKNEIMSLVNPQRIPNFNSLEELMDSSASFTYSNFPSDESWEGGVLDGLTKKTEGDKSYWVKEIEGRETKILRRTFFLNFRDDACYSDAWRVLGTKAVEYGAAAIKILEREAGRQDGGVRDGGVRDGGVRDGGVRDGGVRDGGVRDGGIGLDGGVCTDECSQSTCPLGPVRLVRYCGNFSSADCLAWESQPGFLSSIHSCSFYDLHNCLEWGANFECFGGICNDGRCEPPDGGIRPDGGSAPDGGASCIDDSFEENDTLNTAKTVTIGTYTDLKICPNNEDWYRSLIPSNYSLTARIDFIHASGDLDMEMYDANGNRLTVSNGTGDNESVRHTNIAGPSLFYIKVYGFQGESNTYSMIISKAPVSDGGVRDGGVCTDECSLTNQKQCFGNGWKQCGNHDSDSCLEWGSLVECVSYKTCLDGECVSKGNLLTGPLCGNYTEDSHLSKANSPYNVTCNVSIEEGKQLYIAKGINISMCGNCSITGKVIAEGDIGDRIIFEPSGSKWDTIKLRAGSIIDSCYLITGTNALTVYDYKTDYEDSDIRIIGSIIRDMTQSGIWRPREYNRARDSKILISSNHITQCNDSAVKIEGDDWTSIAISTDYKIIGNYFSNNKEGITINQRFLGGIHDWTIQNNQIKNNNENGIAIFLSNENYGGVGGGNPISSTISINGLSINNNGLIGIKTNFEAASWQNSTIELKINDSSIIQNGGKELSISKNGGDLYLTVDATNNWWGGSCPLSPEEISVTNVSGLNPTVTLQPCLSSNPYP